MISEENIRYIIPKELLKKLSDISDFALFLFGLDKKYSLF